MSLNDHDALDIVPAKLVGEISERSALNRCIALAIGYDGTGPASTSVSKPSKR